MLYESGLRVVIITRGPCETQLRIEASTRRHHPTPRADFTILGTLGTQNTPLSRGIHPFTDSPALYQYADIHPR
jgi:hypothetical protein